LLSRLEKIANEQRGSRRKTMRANCQEQYSNDFLSASEKMDGQKEMDVLCFGGEDWWYHNRAHIDFQLMRRFAKQGIVLYINSIVMQKPDVRQGRKFVQKLIRKAKSISKGLKKTKAGFWVCSPFSLPAHHVAWVRPLNEMLLRFQLSSMTRKLRIRSPVIWVACPTACDVALSMKKSRLVYQRTDCYEAYPNVDVETITTYDRKLKAEADLTIFVNSSLYEKETGQCKKAIYLDHGVDFEMFAVAEQNQQIPADIANIKKPIVGYFGGHADHKVDIELILKIAELLPEVSFVIVGDCAGSYSHRLHEENICLLGQKSYEQIPHYGKCFDVGILPWKINRWTEAANPIKLKEYLALGKPVVSTSAFTELEQYLDIVYQANTPEDFAKCIKKAYSENSPELMAKRRQKVALSSWDSKAEIVLHELFTKGESKVP